MPYITINVSPRTHQITFDDIFNGISEEFLKPSKDTKDTRTYYKTKIFEKDPINIPMMMNAIKSFNQKYADIDRNNLQQYYYSFKIPKRSGGYRQIDAPDPNKELYKALYDMKYIFDYVLYANHHTICYSYCKGRSIYDCVARHQKNDSKWILKSDLHAFFPSTTPEFLYNMLAMQYPFSQIVEHQNMKEEIKKMLSLCFLNGGLPQGTPMSPLLTNMMMIPIDYEISKYCRTHTPILVVTRYADDIFISSKYEFKWQEVQQDLINIFKKFNAPFELNTKKTHYGSRSGRNWMLGLMYNKDGDITLGHVRKNQLKVAIFNYMQDLKNGVDWNLNDLQTLLGHIAYAKNIEPENVKDILGKYENKFDVRTPIEKIISNNISELTRT